MTPYRKDEHSRPIRGSGSIEDLLRKQRTQQFLTHDEKERIKEYAAEQRKKKLHNKKKK